MVMNLCVGRVGPLLLGCRQSQTFYWMGCPEAPKRTSSSLVGGSISLFLKAVEETKAQKPQDRKPRAHGPACWGDSPHTLT